jgi:hypothetical protein
LAVLSNPDYYKDEGGRRGKAVMDSGIRLPVKGNTFLEREISMKNLLCTLGDLIVSIDGRLSLLRQQAKYLGLPPAQLLNFRNMLTGIGAILERLSAKPPQSPMELGLAVEQLKKISKGLNGIGNDVRTMAAEDALRLLQDTAFTDWVDYVFGFTTPTQPKTNIWASGPMN